MAAAIKAALGLEAELVEGAGGLFEVWLEDTPVYSNSGRCGLLPEAEELLAALRARLKPYGGPLPAGGTGPSPGDKVPRPCCPGDQSAPPEAGGCCGPTAACCGPAVAEEASTRRLLVEFLYLDREQCSRCRETERVLEEALAEVGPVLRTTGLEVDLQKVHVWT
ncbi:MAG: DUF2703 domain-containing protein, partial [Clostridia bacterium]|nr:DUF2703 domain-containing protein [Clostridia bacterium]